MRTTSARYCVASFAFIALLVMTMPSADGAAAKAPATPPSNLGPVPVKTQPEALANDVDPALTAITVTFDQPMHDGSWSWVGGGETYPAITGKIAYDEKKMTCTLPVKLEPGKVYWVGINSPSHKNFKSATGKAAQRYAICFATKSADGKATPIPADMAEQAKGINDAVGNAGPVVLKTTPKAFSENVPASTAKVTVAFDQPMRNGSWSWTGGGDTYPKVTGKISYDATLKTCTLPVKLEPGKVYWIGINSPSFKNFQNKANAPAKWYAIVFATAGADGKPTPIPADTLAEAKKINAASGSVDAEDSAVQAAEKTGGDK